MFLSRGVGGSRDHPFSLSSPPPSNAKLLDADLVDPDLKVQGDQLYMAFVSDSM